MIDLTVDEDCLARTVQRARERSIIIPTLRTTKGSEPDPGCHQGPSEGHRAVGHYAAQPVPHYLEERANAARWRVRRRQLY